MRPRLSCLHGLCVVLTLVTAACGAAGSPPGGSSVAPAASAERASPASSGTGSTQPSVSAREPAKPSAGGAATANLSAKPAAGAPITIAWAAPAPDYTPYWVAADEGLFAKHGQNVRLQYIQSGAATQALAAHDIDILSSSGEGINLRAEGQDVKYFATINHTLRYGIYTQKGNQVTISVQGLTGKNYGALAPGAAPDIFVHEYLSQKGVDPAVLKVTYGLGSEAIFAALETGKLEFGALSPPFSFKAQASPSITTLVEAGTVQIPGTTGSLMAYTDWISKHEEEAKGIILALKDAAAFVKQQPAETQQIIAKYLKFDQPTAKQIYDFGAKSWGAPDLLADAQGIQVALKYATNPGAKSLTPADLIYADNKLAKSVQ